MIPIFICEDNEKILDFLAEEIKKFVMIQGYSMEIRGAETDPEQLLEQHNLTEARGVYFLDVDLKNANYDGFSLAEEIRRRDPRGYIIFVTTHGELAYETFKYKLEAMDYIVKDDADQMSSRIVSCLIHIQESLLKAELNSDTAYYTVKIFDDIHTIPMSKIIYFETSAKKHRVILHADDIILEYFDNLQSLEQKMGCDFLRSHRSYLLNKARIRKIDLKNSFVEMDNGETCLLSRKAKKHVKEEM